MPIRLATVDDAAVLEQLLCDYIAESYPGHAGTSATILRQEVLSGGTSQRLLVDARRAGLTGFVAWDPVYDLHWAARGAQIADCYVKPSSRGLGIALELLASLCRVVADEGGVFVSGGAYDRPSTCAFYVRCANVDPGSYEAPPPE